MGTKRPTVGGIREKRLHRRKLRLARAMGVAQEAILQCGEDASEKAITAAAKVKAKALCGNPILIMIVIQLIPILVKIFFSSSSEAQFASRCDRLTSEVCQRLADVHTAQECKAMAQAVGADPSDWMRAMALILNILADIFDWFDE